MDTSRLKRHVGVLNNTGSRVLVVYRTLPDDTNNCLIVETDRVPDMYHDNLIEIANSKEAQETTNFYDVLNRRTFSDGLNALQALHYKGFLRKVPVDLITLYPFPGKELPLELLNAQIDGTLEQYQEKELARKEAEQEAVRQENPLASDDPEAIAKGLLMQAELLDEEASRKREEAYALAPSLKPKRKTVKASDASPETKRRGRPPLSAAEKAERAELRKQKRRERDRAKAAEKRAAKKEAALKEAVDAKVMRDAERLED